MQLRRESNGSLTWIFDRRVVQWAGYCVLLSVCTVLFYQGVADLLTDVDDASIFALNEPVRENFLNFFTLSAQWVGRPTFSFFIWLGSRFWGYDPLWFHALSAAVHTLVCFVLAISLRVLGFSRSFSFVVGALFLINTSLGVST